MSRERKMDLIGTRTNDEVSQAKAALALAWRRHCNYIDDTR